MPNVTYAVEHRSLAYFGTWTVLMNFPAQPTTRQVYITDPWSPGNRFYRVIGR